MTAQQKNETPLPLEDTASSDAPTNDAAAVEREDVIADETEGEEPKTIMAAAEITTAEEEEEATEQADTEELPIEMQYEEVDMDNPEMDPLEWSVRKVIPIPKAYFWETGNDDLPPKIKAWHRTVAALGAAVRFAESAGEVVANIAGLNSTRYDYVTSTMTEDEWARARQIAAERKRQREEHRAKQAQVQAEDATAEAVGVAKGVL